MMKRTFILPCLALLTACNATVNGPFLNHVKAEKRQAQDLEYVADKLMQFPELTGKERADLRWQMRKVQSEVEAVSKISNIVRQHVENPWWGDWFFPFDGWGETAFYVSDESVALNHLTQIDIADLRRLINATQTRLGIHIPLPSYPKMSAKERKAEKAAQLNAEKIAKARAEGKITDPFTERNAPKPAETEAERLQKLPPVPELQPEVKDYLEDHANPSAE